MLHDFQIIVSIFAAFGTGLLAFMFWSSAQTNGQDFTRIFLKYLSLCYALRAIEIIFAVYRTSRISAQHIPFDATIAGLAGRGIESVGYIVMIWFLLKSSTKKALNGG